MGVSVGEEEDNFVMSTMMVEVVLLAAENATQGCTLSATFQMRLPIISAAPAPAAAAAAGATDSPEIILCSPVGSPTYKGTMFPSRADRAFGRNTRHNNTNIDLYLRAMDEVEEHANAEVVKKKSAFGQAKPAKFPQGELFAANDDLTPQKKRGKRKEDSPTTSNSSNSEH